GQPQGHGGHHPGPHRRRRAPDADRRGRPVGLQRGLPDLLLLACLRLQRLPAGCQPLQPAGRRELQEEYVRAAGQAGLREPDRRAGGKAPVRSPIQKRNPPPPGVENTGGYIMIRLIVGTKGSGKTKAMIDMINESVRTTKGSVVVVEKGMKLTYDIASAARLIDLDEYKIQGGEMLYGFVAGLMASNYDITDIYIDGILKVLDHDINRLGVVLDEMAAIAGDSVRVTVTVSADEAMLPHNVKKYL